jgi:ABC-type glycerol-3-phosphate transport system substrate-binding protein
MVFKSSKAKQEAWKFLSDTAFSEKWRREFTLKEGFLPVTKAEAADPHFANDPQLRAFTDLLPNAKFAPLIRTGSRSPTRPRARCRRSTSARPSRRQRSRRPRRRSTG